MSMTIISDNQLYIRLKPMPVTANYLKILKWVFLYVCLRTFTKIPLILIKNYNVISRRTHLLLFPVEEHL